MSSKQYLAIVRYRMAKALKGECREGGCHEKASYMCPKHLAKQNEYNKKSQRSKIHDPKMA